MTDTQAQFLLEMDIDLEAMDRLIDVSPLTEWGKLVLRAQVSTTRKCIRLVAQSYKEQDINKKKTHGE